MAVQDGLAEWKQDLQMRMAHMPGRAPLHGTAMCGRAATRQAGQAEELT